MLSNLSDVGAELVRAWVFPFLLFTALMYFVRGSKAFEWGANVQQSARANLIMFLINSQVMILAFQGGDTFSGTWLSLGLPTLDTQMWSGLPMLAIAAISVVVYDFIDYWNHRIMHTSALWGVHSVHHSDEDMNFTTTYRVHALEPIFMGATYVVGASWLGLPDVAILLPISLAGLHNAYVHMDVDWGHGSFARVLASPRFHKWHHADDPAAYNKNFANLFPIWDVLFGTYYCPGRCDLKLGCDKVYGHNVVLMLLAPVLPLLEKLRSPSASTPATGEIRS